MKLYLSSMSPINKDELLKLIDKQNDFSVVIIPNAWDTYPKERKALEVASCIAMCKGYGFTTSILDLTTSDKQKVEEELKNKSLVWVMGGNTFYLNLYLHKSGFSEVIKEHLDNGLVYGGESAGAVVTGLTLHGVEHLDDPKESPEIIWDGLKLVDFSIIPHWGWEKYGEYLRKAKQEMEKFTKVVTIDNDKALVINGSELKFIDSATRKVN
jgi:dipeptidase E